MKKIIVAIICVLLVMSLLLMVGCRDVEFDEGSTSGKSMFVVVEQSDIWYIVYHKDTKVMYEVSSGYYNCGTFTLLVDQDGKPLLWQGD